MDMFFYLATDAMYVCIHDTSEDLSDARMPDGHFSGSATTLSTLHT